MSAGHLGAIIGDMSEDGIDPRVAKGLATALFVAVGVAVPLVLLRGRHPPARPPRTPRMALDAAALGTARARDRHRAGPGGRGARQVDGSSFRKSLIIQLQSSRLVGRKAVTGARHDRELSVRHRRVHRMDVVGADLALVVGEHEQRRRLDRREILRGERRCAMVLVVEAVPTRRASARGRAATPRRGGRPERRKRPGPEDRARRGATRRSGTRPRRRRGPRPGPAAPARPAGQRGRPPSARRGARDPRPPAR